MGTWDIVEVENRLDKAFENNSVNQLLEIFK